MALINHGLTKPTIDLSGRDGNVFHLIGTAKTIAQQLDIPYKPITDAMMSKDYLYAIFVFNREFGEYIDLILPEGVTPEDIQKAGL